MGTQKESGIEKHTFSTSGEKRENRIEPRPPIEKKPCFIGALGRRGARQSKNTVYMIKKRIKPP